MLSAHFNFAASHLSRNVASASRAHAKAAEQIASGYKINVASDGPADLIISEKLRSQIDGLERAIRNTSESNNILGIMDGALGQVQNILTKMSSLAIEAANSGVVSPDRVAANQAQIDSGLQAIERLIETTAYGGQKLLGDMQERGVIDQNYVRMVEAGKFLRDQERNNPGGVINLGTNNGLTRPAVPGEVYTRDDMRDSLFMLARDQEHEDQISADGKTLNGEKTFVLPPAEEGGEPTELTFAEGTSLEDIVSALREHGAGLPPIQEGELQDIDKIPGKGELYPEITADLEDLFHKPAGVLGGRIGTDINTVELSAAQLAALAGMSEEGAKSSLADYMNDFTKEIELDVDGWNKLSDADQELLLTADNFANMKLDDLVGDRNIAEGDLTLSDLYSGKKASLTKEPAAAIGVLDKARKSVTAHRAQIAATQAMAQHGMNADAAALEATMRYESYIRDTQIDEAVTEMARTEILQQTGMTLLKKTMEQYTQNITNLLDLTA